MQKKNITVVLLLLGRYEVQTAELVKGLDELKLLQNKAEVIVVADSLRWKAAPHMQMLPILEDWISVLYCQQETAVLPAQVMNLALSHVKTEYVQFSLLQDPTEKRFVLFDSMISAHCVTQMTKGKRKFLEESAPPVYYIRSDMEGFSEFPANEMNTYGWAQSSLLGFGLGALCVPMAVLSQIGSIDENPLLQDSVERWYALATIKNSYVKEAGVEAAQTQPPALAEYPLERPMFIPEELALRYATYCHGIAAPVRTPETCAAEFAADINAADAEVYAQITGIRAEGTPHYQTHYKILILGGPWEYHHNQICFFNYIEQLYGQGFATYHAMFDSEVFPSMMLTYDLVIFTRCRSDCSLEAMRFCRKQGIPSLYMIDDNWMTIAKDHPDVGNIFVEGNSNYDNFIEALGLCKATWLFNDTLKEDVLPYTNCVQQFKISINPTLFAAEHPRQPSDKEIYIGFSGSLRYDDTAFLALARCVRRHPNVRVVLMGILSPSQEKLFKNLNPLRLNFSGYLRYAQQMAAIQPDLLIAPLMDSRTARSKCYNKYIESGIVGAACICSPYAPYTDVIEDGVNGFFVKEDTFQGWEDALEAVLSDIPKLRSVQAAIKADIEKKHTVHVLLKPFVQKIRDVIEMGDLQDD